MADGPGGAWTFGSSILSFSFPMILVIVVLSALYVAYTKPEFVPGHRAPGLERPVSYTAVPGPPRADEHTRTPGRAAEAAPETTAGGTMAETPAAGTAGTAGTPPAETMAAETPAAETTTGPAAETEDTE
jgi:hypothetical protein